MYMLLQKMLFGNVSDVYEVKVPELELTSSVDLSNSKGRVILDWSSYDINNKYFVIYRKKENEENYEVVLELDDKFNASSFTDIFSNDENVPVAPVINVNGELDKNIKIDMYAQDNGTKYVYYIEAYDMNSKALLSVSNICYNPAEV